MNYRPLGSTGFKVSEVGFGSWQLGGKGWGRPSGDGVGAALRALEIGFNLFDTAPVYGFGRAEEILGKALRDRGKNVVLVSKGGLIWDDRERVAHDASPKGLRESLEGSLKRLRRERIEVFILHWPDPAVPLAESISALDDSRTQGKIGAWGLSNLPAEDVLRLGSAPPPRPSIVLEYPLNWLRRYAGEHARADGGELVADRVDPVLQCGHACPSGVRRRGVTRPRSGVVLRACISPRPRRPGLSWTGERRRWSAGDSRHRRLRT